MPTRAYKLYTTTAGNNAATLVVAANSRIRAISWDLIAINGANVTGGETVQLCINMGSSSIGTNNTSGFDLSSCTVTNNVASSVASAQKTIAGLDIPLKAGDQLCLNTTTSGGNAETSRAYTCHVYVEQA